MSDIRFNIRWVGHCEHNDKLWGWFTDLNQEVPKYKVATRYCFWGTRGKGLSMNSHPNSFGHSMTDIISRKKSNGYSAIEVNDLLNMWPTFYEDLERKFIWMKLSEQI